ncbi:hypothetical protein KAR34_01055 [bacterium]|nr:hypothetical protein [bacterium]
MKFEARLTGKDWKAVAWIGLTQVNVAWVMALLDVVYAPIPMFVAAVVAGFLFKGRPKHASLGAAMAGVLGGWLAEWAFHTVRIQNRVMNWAQLDSSEQLGLAAAEMLLYAALLSFFAAFFSWGTSKDTSAEDKGESPASVQPTEPMYSPLEAEQPEVDIPLFKEDPEATENSESSV